MFEAWTLRSEDVKRRSEALRDAIRTLDDRTRLAYYQQYEKRVKDPDTYAVLNWFFLAGLHHFYLGKVARGLINLGLMLGGILLMTQAPGWGLLLILAVIVIELPALFRSQIIVENNNVERGFAELDKLASSGSKVLEGG